MDKIINTIAEELNIKPNQVESTVKLIDEGNTIPFIARYRKEVTGGLSDEILRDLGERLTYLRNLEKRRYSILNQIKLYNKTVTYGTQKITTISDEYNAKFEDNILKIYIPEVMPSYKNLKTHAYKNILLNIADPVFLFVCHRILDDTRAHSMV